MNSNAVTKIDFTSNEARDAANIENCVMNARASEGVAFVPLYLLSVPRYQRGEQNKIGYLMKNWDDLAYDYIKVSYRDGNLFVVDGLQRKTSAERMGKLSLQCRILEGLTEEDEVRIYKNQNMGKAPMMPYDKITAEDSIGADPGANIIKICNECGVILSAARRARKGECGCAAAVMNIYQECGADGLRWVFGLVNDLGWRCMVNGYKKILMYAFKALYKSYRNHDAVKAMVIETCQGKEPDAFIAECVNRRPRAKNAVMVVLTQKCRGIK